MKKFFSLIFALFALMCCSKPDEPDGGNGSGTGSSNKTEKLSVSVEQLHFTASGGEQTFTVTTKLSDWSAGTRNNFINCRRDGSTVTVVVNPNLTIQERNGSVVVTAGEESCEIAIIQEPKGGVVIGDNPSGTADGYNPYPESDFVVSDNTLFMRDVVAKGITSLDLENTTFYLSLDTPPEFIPQEGETYIINNRFDLFPDGALLCVQKVTKTDEGYRVFYNSRVGIQVFKKLNINEQDIDVSSNIKKILDGNGNEVPFARTKAINSDKWTITIPEVGWDLGKGWEMTPKLTLENNLRVQLIMDNWSISTLDVKYDVDATLGADIAISGEKEMLSVHKKIMTIVCGAIPVGPILITPNIDIFGWFTTAGTVSFEGSISYETGIVANAHYDSISYLSGDIVKKDKDKFSYSVGPKIGGSLKYGLQFGPAIGIYGAVLEVGVSVSAAIAEEVSNKMNIADPLTWGYWEGGLGYALQSGEYSVSYVLGGNVFLTGMGFPLSYTLKDVKFPIETRNLVPTISKEYRCEANGKNIIFHTWVKNKGLFYPDLFLDVGDGNRYPFDFDDGMVSQLENGADSVMVTAQASVQDDRTQYFKVMATYRDVETELRSYNARLVLVDEDEEYAMKQILADIYACRGGDWDGCEWTTSKYGVANLPYIKMTTVNTGGRNHYEVIIPKEWPLGDNLYVGSHSGNVKNFSWELDYEADTHLSRVEIKDPNCKSAYVGDDCDTYIFHSTFEEPRLYLPLNAKTVDVAGSYITDFSLSSTWREDFKPRKVILDNCPRLAEIALRGDSSHKLTDVASISANKCPALKSVYVSHAELFPGFLDNIEMAGGKLVFQNVTGIGDVNLKADCEDLRINNSSFGIMTVSGLGRLKQVYFMTNTFKTATFTNLPALDDVAMNRLVCDKISVSACPFVKRIEIRSYSDTPSNVEALSVTDCPMLNSLSCYSLGLSSFEASGLPAIQSLYCNGNKKLTGLMLPVFDQMFDAGYTPYYDIRYEYYWEELKKDNGYGYYYEGEPERGYHRYD